MNMVSHIKKNKAFFIKFLPLCVVLQVSKKKKKKKGKVITLIHDLFYVPPPSKSHVPMASCKNIIM